jgi:hypothetical protein
MGVNKINPQFCHHIQMLISDALCIYLWEKSQKIESKKWETWEFFFKSRHIKQTQRKLLTNFIKLNIKY